ncbi:hypothetical protein D9611_000536 [Ephemerocybe angulata]|uniref:Uncharacterized protein n=1 Tax=Ephemerocybe angulata TaxID=980116 RepID=A0A8H5BP19_9AGAR|nr:hypothetical protein D9611_000536 [Tulosesus angulatus]
MVLPISSDLEARRIVYVYDNHHHKPIPLWARWLIVSLIFLVIILIAVFSSKHVKAWIAEKKRKRAAAKGDTSASLLAPQFDNSPQASTGYVPPPVYAPHAPLGDYKEGAAPAFPSPTPYSSNLATPTRAYQMQGMGKKITGRVMAVGDWLRRTRPAAAPGDSASAPLIKPEASRDLHPANDDGGFDNDKAPLLKA